MDITKVNHIMCSFCKKEIGFIEMMNGTIEMQEVLITCNTCKKVFREKDLMMSNTHDQGNRFKRQNPYGGC